MQFVCSNCGHHFELPITPEQFGQSILCPRCVTPITIEDPDAEHEGGNLDDATIDEIAGAFEDQLTGSPPAIPETGNPKTSAQSGISEPTEMDWSSALGSAPETPSNMPLPVMGDEAPPVEPTEPSEPKRPDVHLPVSPHSTGELPMLDEDDVLTDVEEVRKAPSTMPLMSAVPEEQKRQESQPKIVIGSDRVQVDPSLFIEEVRPKSISFLEDMPERPHPFGGVPAEEVPQLDKERQSQPGQESRRRSDTGEYKPPPQKVKNPPSIPVKKAPKLDEDPALDLLGDETLEEDNETEPVQPAYIPQAPVIGGETVPQVPGQPAPAYEFEAGDDEPAAEQSGKSKKQYAWAGVGLVLLLAIIAAIISVAGNNEAPSQPERAEMTPRQKALMHYAKGNQLMSEKKIDAAIEAYKKALLEDVDFARAYRELGSAYGQKNDARNLLKYYKHYLQLAPKADDAPKVRAIVKEHGG